MAGRRRGTFAVANVARRYGAVPHPISALEAVASNETTGLFALVAFVAAIRRGEVLSRPREC